MSDDNQTPPQAPGMGAEPTRAPKRSAAGGDKRGLLTVLVIFGSLFLVILVFAVVMLGSFGGDGGFGAAPNQIGVIEITGPISDSKQTVADLQKFARNDAIKAIVVRIDSPGGAVAPSQEMFQAVKQAAEKKPLAVSMGSVAASGGYYIALGAPHIFANPGTVTGSIGVISQMFNVQGLLETIQVDVTTLKTGPYKDTGSPFREFTETDRRYFDTLITDIYEQFVGDVAQARGLEVKAVREVADGRVFTGRQALKHKLIDELGTMEDAVAWVKKGAKLDGKHTLVYPPDPNLGLLSSLIKGATQTAVQELKAQQTPVIEYRMP